MSIYLHFPSSLFAFSHVQQIGGKLISVLNDNSCCGSLDEKNEVKLHLLNYVFKLVAMNIRDWLSALKHIEKSCLGL
jgi:hypothetical protein